jgi:hypothetical protein
MFAVSIRWAVKHSQAQLWLTAAKLIKQHQTDWLLLNINSLLKEPGFSRSWGAHRDSCEDLLQIAAMYFSEMEARGSIVIFIHLPNPSGRTRPWSLLSL